MSPADSINPSDCHIRDANLDNLLEEAEEKRLNFMQRHHTFHNIFLTMMVLGALIGGGLFAWLLLVNGQPIIASLCLLVAIIIPAGLHNLADRPIKAYKLYYKNEFLPKLATVIGKLSYSQARGISHNILEKTHIVPKYDDYHAEDCFYGDYKGVKIILSEARLFRKEKMIFNGLFVLMELKEKKFEGISIYTTSRIMAKKLSEKLDEIALPSPDKLIPLHAYTNKDDNTKLLQDPNLVNELEEMYRLFDDAELSASIFRGKFIFFMIPTVIDMFEAPDVHIPIRTRHGAKKCQKEVKQLLSIIDILELYKNE